MNKTTKWWLAGGSVFCALVIAHCVRKGESPLVIEQADDSSGFPYYLTYNTTPIDPSTIRPPENDGRIVFGDININGGDYASLYGGTNNQGGSGSNGSNGGCCDPCANSTGRSSGIFSGVINSGLLPGYVSQYISRPLDSLTLPDIVSNSGASPYSAPEPAYLKARVA